MRNRVRLPELIRPRRVFANKVENVNRRARKIKKKNRGTAPKVSGSTKYIKARIIIQRKNVSIRVGKKFFLSFISFSVFLDLTLPINTL
jgi:hypothetical protein